tara:strand:+ start:1874 stop:2815 length:942 start_codon:yes stop_codon:yes gene_type:complete
MSNILIIKHGSLGDIAQASGAIQDIFETHRNDKLYMLTTKPYHELFKKNPYINDIIIDKRLSRFNLIYLYFLMRKIKKYRFSKIYDLQNSNRSDFYKKILFPKADFNTWSSTNTTLPLGTSKKDFDKDSVLKRFEHQLTISGVKVSNVLKPDFSWCCDDISSIKKKYNLDKYIILFPFSSSHLTIKRWPYYKELANQLIYLYGNRYQIITAPGQNEINEAGELDATCILENNKALSITKLASLIKDSQFIISNDTGPAHMAAHMNAKGLVLFGSHTTANKVGMIRDNIKIIEVHDLKKLSTEKVLNYIKQLIN